VLRSGLLENLIAIRVLAHFLSPTQQETKMCLVLFLPSLTIKYQRGIKTVVQEAGRRQKINLSLPYGEMDPR
jgi:hypothetical protein